MSDATSGYGCLIKLGDGGTPETFTSISEVKSISGPSGKLDIIDVTSLSSPNNMREKLATLNDEGQVSIDMLFLPGDSTQDHITGINYIRRNRELRNFQILFSDSGATTATFAAYVTSFAITAALEGALEATATLDISGQITWA